MGVDIYVGTLTRYYARDWQTIVQQTMPTKIVYQGKNAPKEGETVDQAKVQQVVLAWRARVESATKEHIHGDWGWDEKPGVEYVTDKPGWWGHNALRAVALDPRTDLGRKLGSVPQHLPGDWGGLKMTTKTDYGQVIWPQWWLPLKFDGAFTVPSPAGEPKTIGSTETLITELMMLNAATLRADHDKLEWYRRAEELPKKLEDWTVGQAFGFGLGVFLEFAEQSKRRRLPLLLDW